MLDTVQVVRGQPQTKRTKSFVLLVITSYQGEKDSKQRSIYTLYTYNEVKSTIDEAEQSWDIGYPQHGQRRSV